MNKTLPALLLFGAFSAAASAQTNVTVYGLLDIGVTSEQGGPDGSKVTLGSGIQSGSRLGFKGSEDLGGGLAAIFTVENGFNPDDGTQGQGRLFGRQVFVGLQGGFGTVTAGRQYTPLWSAIDSLDPVDGIAGGSHNLMRRDVRTDNTIRYASPNLSGFSGELAYSVGEVAGNSAASRILGAGLAYANGRLIVKLAHQSKNNVTDTDRSKSTYLGGSYNFGIVKALLGYEANKGVGAIDDQVAVVGAIVPFGASTMMLSYRRKSDKSAANDDASQIALAYTYALSKRTNLYSSYTRINNENTLVSRTRTGDGSGDREFNVGIRHKF